MGKDSVMEPLKESSNVTRLPGADDGRLREPPHNFEAEQALLGSILAVSYTHLTLPTICSV